MERYSAVRLVQALVVAGICALMSASSCSRDNPVDTRAKDYISGSRPHVAFIKKAVSGFLYDTLSIGLVWSDTATGGQKGAIQTYYFSWFGDTAYSDSAAGGSSDTCLVKRAFPLGIFTARVKAVDMEGRYSLPESTQLRIVSSHPRIVGILTPDSVEKTATFSVGATAVDTGGTIQSFLWAKNGKDFTDTTATGSFSALFQDTGRQTLLVKVRDNKAIESAVDTFHVRVYEKHNLVLYDGNGNSGGTAPTDTARYVVGQSVTVLGNAGALVKTGFVFTGWNTSPDGQGAGYSPGAAYSMDTGGVTLYALWQVNHTFAVVYNGNGNTSGSVPVDSNTYAAGISVLVLGNTGGLLRTGYTFIGWNTLANGSGIGYASGLSFVMGSAAITLYAQWTANPTFMVTYIGNGNTAGAVPVDGNNYASGGTVTVLGNVGALVKTGNTLIGWNTKADGSGTAYASGVTFAMGNATVTLFAQWTSLPTYGITYSGNTNAGGTAPVDSNRYIQGQTVTTLNVGTLVKTGYTFAGWNTKTDGTGTAYASGVTFAMGNANATLFAQWTAVPTYTVTYDGGTSTSGTVPLDNGSYTVGQTVKVLGNTGSLAKPGFSFVGWNTQANGGGIGYAAGVSFVMGSASVTLFAQWTANPTYTVTYTGNGSTGGAVPIDVNNYLSGATATILGNTGALVKSANTFIGWNTQANGGGTSYSPGVAFTIGSSGVTLYAQWTGLPTYTVYYIANGSTGGTAPADANRYTQGQTVTTLNVGTLVKIGCSFTGWNTKTDGSGTGYAAGVTFAMGAANDTLYAQWASIPTFSVTYNGNGNSAGTVPADNNGYTSGQSVTVLGNTGSLAKTGFTFVGWNTQVNGAGIGYAAGVSFAMGSANVTVYAQWTANPTYSVTYDGNGNTGGTVPVDGNNYVPGATITVLTNTGALVKTGNTFIGWNTKTDGTGTSYASGVTFAIGSGSIILYAQWTALPTYAVTYSGNKSTGGTAPIDANRYMQGQTVTTLNVGTLAKTGYTFTGWNSKTDGTGTGYAPGATLTMGAASITLYAQWALIATYTVTYTANGATSGAVPTDNTPYAAGQSVTVANNSGNLASTGKTFVGWNTQANGGGIGYAAGTSFLMGSANVVLYAQWTANPTYTVTYNGNTNTGGNVPVDGNSYLAGAPVTVLGNPGALVKNGYTFIGWDTIAAGGGVVLGATLTMGSANITLYSQWTAKATYTVTYNANVSTSGTAPVDGNNYLQSATVIVLGNTGSLAKTGNTFTGWNTKADGTGTGYGPGATFAMGIANVTLYAQWTIIATYTVSYNANGATSGAVPTGSAQYAVGQSVTVANNSGNLALTGKTFVGWNTQAAGNGIGYAAGTSFLMGSSNVILYAQWTANPTYIVTYNGNTNTGGNVPVDGNSYLAGTPLTVLGNPGALVKTGYTFIGWDTIAAGGGVVLGATLTMGSANITLYAQWTAKATYTVTYNANVSTSGTAPVDGNNYLQSATVIVLGNTGSLAKTGNTFTGWNTKADGTGTGYGPGATFAMGAANVTLYAQWTIIATYAVSYNTNGATSGAVPTGSAQYAVGQSVTVANNSGNLALTGKTFVGWNTQAIGGGIGYAAGTSFLMGSGNVVLYAQWTANPTYTVTYNGNTNTGGNVPVDGNSYLAGAPVIVLGNPGALVKTGYTFIGWDTIAAGGGVVLGATLTMGSANVTLYAQWTALPTYSVSYSANVSTSGTAPVDGNNYLQSATVIVLGNTGSLAKTGNTFTGWNTKADGTGTGYGPGATFAMGAANVTLYAQWTIIATYAVSYNTNGATSGVVPTGSAQYAVGQSVTVANNSGNLALTGKTFVGWNTQANGGGIGYAAGTSFLMGSGNVVLYAQWTANPTYTVTYNGNTNSGGNVPVDGNSYLAGAPVIVLGNPGALVKAGYTFIGWDTIAAGGGVVLGATLTMGSANITLYAQWIALPTYSVSYSANVSTSGTAPVDGNNYLQNATVVVLGNTGSLAKTGYSFAGWNTKADGTGTGYAPGSILTMGAASDTLYAQWTLIATYTVTYDGNGNTGGLAPVDAGSYQTGASVTVLDNIGGLIQPGYTFAGWNTKANGKGVGYQANGSFVMGTANVKLYAQWTVNPTYFTVTYNGNGSTSGTVPVDNTLYTLGQTAVVLNNTGGLTNGLLTFSGWNTAPNDSGITYNATQALPIIGNDTLYAIWH